MLLSSNTPVTTFTVTMTENNIQAALVEYAQRHYQDTNIPDNAKLTNLNLWGMPPEGIVVLKWTEVSH